jgi:hypothetical protein
MPYTTLKGYGRVTMVKGAFAASSTNLFVLRIASANETVKISDSEIE